MNKRDLEDIIARGLAKGNRHIQAAMINWEQPDLETKIGQMYQQIKQSGMPLPAEVRKEMEARYGENQ